ncbi:hypothetical protein PCE1_004342 [Barthelona sp. PCE]
MERPKLVRDIGIKSSSDEFTILSDLDLTSALFDFDRELLQRYTEIVRCISMLYTSSTYLSELTNRNYRNSVQRLAVTFLTRSHRLLTEREMTMTQTRMCCFRRQMDTSKFVNFFDNYDSIVATHGARIQRDIDYEERKKSLVDKPKFSKAFLDFMDEHNMLYAIGDMSQLTKLLYDHAKESRDKYTNTKSKLKNFTANVDHTLQMIVRTMELVNSSLPDDKKLDIPTIPKTSINKLLTMRSVFGDMHELLVEYFTVDIDEIIITM